MNLRLRAITAALALSPLAAPVLAAPPVAVEPTPPPPVPQPRPEISSPPSPSPPRLSVIRNPDWLVKPTGEDLGRYFPARAAREGIGGHAVISCEVALTTELAGCQVVSENPPGYGFGEAAVQASSVMRMSPASRDGQPVAGVRVRIPITFPTPEPPPPPPGPVVFTSVPMAGDWRALGPEQVSDGKPFRYFYDAASVSRQGDVVRLRMALTVRTPTQMPEMAHGASAEILAMGADVELDCVNPRSHPLAMLVLHGPPAPRLDSVTGLQATVWGDDSADSGFLTQLRQAACTSAPAGAGPRGPLDLMQARDAWLAERK